MPRRKMIGAQFAERLGKRFDDPYVEDMDSIAGCKYVALQLFYEIEKHHGRSWARRIFAMWGTPPTLTRLNEIRDHAILSEYDTMKPKPDANKLARKIVERNRAAPPDQRWGGTDTLIVRRRIGRLIADRKKKIKAGTWGGPEQV